MCFNCSLETVLLFECRGRLGQCESVPRSRFALCEECSHQCPLCRCEGLVYDQETDSEDELATHLSEEYFEFPTDDDSEEYFTSDCASAALDESNETLSSSTVSTDEAEAIPGACYLLGTSFPDLSGRMRAVETLQQGDVLRAHNGGGVSVAQIIRHPQGGVESTCVWLETAKANLIITHDHRMMIRLGGREQSIPAGHLGVGGRVMCAGGEARVVSARGFPGFAPPDVYIYQIKFDPDTSIDTWFCGDGSPTQDAFVTKGAKGERQRRRGGMGRRW